MNNASLESEFPREGYVLGIDASNIRLGGGITHLIELLGSFDPSQSTFKKIIVWGNSTTLSQIPEFSWLEKISPAIINGNIFFRTLWQFVILRRQAKVSKCSVLLIPGGIFWGGFYPVVLMSQNLLPFEAREIKRYGVSIRALKFHVIKVLQSISFRNASGVIFLSSYAKKKVIDTVQDIKCDTKVIPHGLTTKFQVSDKANLIDSQLGISKPIKVIYVSNIELYKHQENVLTAVYSLRKKGYLVEVDFIGPSQVSTLRKLQDLINHLDPINHWSRYFGEVPYAAINAYYKSSDIGVFASSCETFGITLLEKMACGLPIACSNMSCMPEILQDGGLYFNPEDPTSIADAIEQYLLNPQLRVEKSLRSIVLARNYSWEKCAQSTFSFLEKIAREYKK
jgi:glycosyltransferase involved in cell wall biosynthesis